MDLRLRNLEQLDARAVPLPHGTEVVTRVDRIVGERRVPHGSVGRVTKADGETLEVTVVGVGVLRYARDEVSPRRIGQALFAHRRADAWEALQPCIVLESTVGSQAWGLANEGSDVDRRGIFTLPFTWTQGLVEPPEDLVSADGSATYWAAGKAIRQALRADPNTLEMLFLPSTQPRDPIGAWILAEREAFVSVEIYGTFGRYALGQLRRLEQGLRLAEHRAIVLEWLRDDPAMTLDAVAARLAKVSTRAILSDADRVHQAKQYVKQLYRSLADQGLLDASEFAALVRFARDKAPLSDAGLTVMTRVLDEEETRREHVVVYLSGAHAYGFPSPDSDLDLKAIHVAKTADLLGLEVPPPAADRAEVIEGVEIDYTSNELAHSLAGILGGNGNFLERVLGRTVARASPLLEELRPIARRALSRRVHRHYRGFALNQLRFLEKEPTVKKLLYVLRTTTTGIHLLATGELEADLTALLDRYDLAGAKTLVEKKRAGERVGLDAELLEAWRSRVDALFARLMPRATSARCQRRLPMRRRFGIGCSTFAAPVSGRAPGHIGRRMFTGGVGSGGRDYPAFGTWLMGIPLPLGIRRHAERVSAQACFRRDNFSAR